MQVHGLAGDVEHQVVVVEPGLRVERLAQPLDELVVARQRLVDGHAR